MTRPITVIPNECILVNGFLTGPEADRFFVGIRGKARWKKQVIRMFGKELVSPRLVAWHGDRNAVYPYSGTTHFPNPWFMEIQEIREKAEAFMDTAFNSVLLNLYRNGKDSMERHCDDERELGAEPTIASVSLGAKRRFVLHPVNPAGRPGIHLDLEHGSLLIMKGKSQENWKHSVPKTTLPVGQRINLTYRNIPGRNPAYP